ncbi:hypothetical protein WJX84_005629 [Apatococcus fuscideae]|uniref:BZIP domain-containing protein n=1 Tax=Apatococcus fuscideae TaxID=2026836 RepID=A0AAW1SVF3_9CHLO
MQQADPPPGDTQNYLDKSQQHEQPQQHELLTQTPMGEDIYKDGDGADLDLAQDEGREDFTGSLDNDKSNKTARALELQEKNRKAQRRFRARQKSKLSELEVRVAELVSQMNSVVADKTNLESRVSVLLRVLQMRDEQIEQLRSGQKVPTAEEQGEGMKDDLVLTLHEEAPITLNAALIKQMTTVELVKLWKGYVEELAVCLVAVEKDTEGKSMERLKALTTELTTLIIRVAISNPMVTKTFVVQKLEETPHLPHNEETIEMWLRVMRSLALTKDQRTELCQLRQLFVQKLSGIVDQRRELHQVLMSSVPAAINARHTALQYLRASESLEKLRANLREEHNLKMDWTSTLFRHILTPVQCARCVVQAWPWSPDTLAICSWVAVEEGDSGAIDLLKMGPPAQHIMAPGSMIPHALQSTLQPSLPHMQQAPPNPAAQAVAAQQSYMAGHAATPHLQSLLMQQQGMQGQPGLLQQVGMQGHQPGQHLQQAHQQQQQQQPNLAALLAGVNGTRIGPTPLGGMPNGMPQFAMPQYPGTPGGYSTGIGLGIGNQPLGTGSTAALASMYGSASQGNGPSGFPPNMAMMPTSNQGQFPGLQAYQKVALPTQQSPVAQQPQQQHQHQQQPSQQLPQQQDQQQQQQPSPASIPSLPSMQSPGKLNMDSTPSAEPPAHPEAPPSTPP